MIFERIISKENLISVGFALTAILLFGYQFNNGDQEEFLPYVYKLLNPQLYPGDMLVDFQIHHLNIRYISAYFLAGGGYLIGLQNWLFIVHFSCLFFINKFLTAMAVRRSPWNLAAILPSFFLIVFYSVPVGGNTLYDIQFTPTMPALALGCFALERFDTKKYSLAMFLCGIASCFQLLIGLHLMILMLAVLFIDFRSLPISAKVKLPLVYIVAASPMLLPILYRQFYLPVTYDKDLYFDILFIFRNGHHYSPLLFPLKSYLKGFLFIILMIFVFLRQTREKNGKAPQFLVMVLIGCVVYSIGFEMLRIEAVAKTQWFKATIWMVLYSIPVISAFVSDRIRWNIETDIRKLMLVYAILILVLFNSEFIPTDQNRARYRLGNYKKDDLQLLHQWIKNNLPDSAVVLSFPSDDALRCETQRSSPVTYKAIVHEPEFMMEWYKRIQKFYGLDRSVEKTMNEQMIRGDSIYHSATLPDWINASEETDCLIINNLYLTSTVKPPGFEIARFGHYSAFSKVPFIK